MKEKILAKLLERFQTTKGIPAIEETASSILDTLNDERKNTKEIVDLIVSDFTITQKVLKLVNSAMYRPFAKNIDSIGDAVKVLGNDALVNIVLGVSIISNIEVDNDENLSKTLIASQIAKIAAPKGKIEKASVATLIANIGTLFSTKYLPEEMEEVQLKINDGLSVDDAYRAIMGMTVMELGAEIAKHWKLPTYIVGALDGTGDPDIVKITKFSNRISSLLREEKFEEAATLTNEIIDDEDQHDKLGLFIQNKSITSVNTNEFKFVPKAEFPVRNISVNQSSIETELRKFIEELKTEPRPNLIALANSVFNEFSRLLKTSHALFFHRHRMNEFAMIVGQGKGIDEIRGKFRIRTDGKQSIFNAVIDRKVFLYVDDTSKLKEGVLPANFKLFFGNSSRFILLPVPQDVVNGLLYFDWEDPIEFSEVEFEAIKEAIKEIRDMFIKFIK